MRQRNPRNPGWGLGESQPVLGRFFTEKENSSHRCSPQRLLDGELVVLDHRVGEQRLRDVFEFDHALLAELALHLDLEAFALPDRHDPSTPSRPGAACTACPCGSSSSALGITSTMIRGTSSL